MLHVTCALIEQNGCVLCAQRSMEMHLPLKWEFPGGKREAEETLEQCVIREIREELGLDIHIHDALPSSVHEYPDGKKVCLHPFLCGITGGELHLKEHSRVQWLAPPELHSLDWAEADIPIVEFFLKERTAD